MTLRNKKSENAIVFKKQCIKCKKIFPRDKDHFYSSPHRTSKSGIEYRNNKESFFLTYGDALSDINLSKLKEFHNSKKPLVTVTAVRPPARFGSLEIENGLVKKFGEKDQAKEGWINGGFFALEPSVKDFIDNANTIFEKFPLEEISKIESLVAYQHPGFWQCADTIRELELLEKAIKDNNYAENYKAL